MVRTLLPDQARCRTRRSPARQCAGAFVTLIPGSSTMIIRREEPSDTAAIAAVTVAAFKNSSHSDHTEQFIVQELRNAGVLSVSLVAEDGGIVIGHVAV